MVKHYTINSVTIRKGEGVIIKITFYWGLIK
jgi:hypothetical protein